MRILDKYILKELLSPFVFGICAFSSILVGTGTLFRIAQYITKYGASLTSVTKMFFYSLPAIIVVTFPMSMLLASLLAFSRLSSTSEITAMKSGGIGFYRLAAPVIVAAFFVSLFAIGFNEFLVPAANSAYNRIIYYEIEKNTKPKSQEHIVIKEVKDGSIHRLTYARKFEEGDSTMYGVSLQEFENETLKRMESAERAEWKDNQWVMYNGTIHDLSDEGGIQRTLKFNQQIMPLDRDPKSISLEQKKPEEMSIKELKQQIKALKSQYVSTNLYEVELQQRLSIPMASLIFALVGTPLGLSKQRSTSSSLGFGLSIVIIFIYYSVMTFTGALGQGGALSPFLAAWIPNIIAIFGGIYLIHRASK